jgi:hypothetical protein
MGFSFARMARIVHRTERTRGPRRRQRRNAGDGPDPSYQRVVATHLRQVLKNYSAYDSFEISDPRWVHSIKGWTWLTCVRFREQGRVRSYALFLDGNKIIDDRFAVQTDSYDLQTYYPFERIWHRPADQIFFPRRATARRRHDQPALPATSKPDT